MKLKNLFLLVPFLIVCFGKAQTVITNGMLYNYNVGDSIHYQSFDYSKGYLSTSVVPPTLVYIYIKGKHVSPMQDTITYTVLRTNVDYVPCSSCPLPYTTSVVTQQYNEIYTNLNAPHGNSITPAIMSTCQTVFDTTFVNSCGKLENNQTTQGMCFESPAISFKTIAGVGLFNTMIINNNMIYGFKTDLIAYHKVGEPACGKIGIMPTGILSNKAPEMDVKLYPNPANQVLNVDLPASGVFAQAHFLISDCIGKPVMEGQLESEKPIKQINTTHLSAGIYFLRLSLNHEQTVTKRFVITR